MEKTMVAVRQYGFGDIEGSVDLSCYLLGDTMAQTLRSAKVSGLNLNNHSEESGFPEKQRSHYDLTILSGGTTLNRVQGLKGFDREMDSLRNWSCWVG